MGLKLLITENGKGGKRKMIVSCGFLADELRQCSKEEGVRMAGQCGNAWSGLENQSQEVGSERKSKKEEVEG